MTEEFFLWLTPEETRAVLVARLASLAQGMSGVSLALLKQIEAFLHHDLLPLCCVVHQRFAH
jgi:histidine ammonia-lyase